MAVLTALPESMSSSSRNLEHKKAIDDVSISNTKIHGSFHLCMHTGVVAQFLSKNELLMKTC